MKQCWVTWGSEIISEIVYYFYLFWGDLKPSFQYIILALHLTEYNQKAA